MENFDIYKDIAERTNGDLYIGVSGPVRTGKSTFISKFMENFVIPNIENPLERQIATDEMPIAGDGKTVMTTQPKFIPANAVKVKFNNNATANVKLIDCVGYFVEGANGNIEDGKQRLVKTPWSDKEIPFETASEIGTEKVIKDYSTVGIMITSDGSITEIERENYIQAEEKCIKQLKLCGKPFIVIVNSKSPQSDIAIKVCQEIEEKYGVSVISENVNNLDSEKLSAIFEKILFEFPMQSFNVSIPNWIEALPNDSNIIAKLIENVKESSQKIKKMKDFSNCEDIFNDSEYFEKMSLNEIKLGEGKCEYSITAKDGIFYKVLSEECEEKIENDCDLMRYIKDFSKSKKKFCKIKNALLDAENNGYGVVNPSIEDMQLSEPEITNKNGQCSVKIKAKAPSLHIVKVDVCTEVNPIVGTEKQGEEIVEFINEKYKDSPKALLDTNLFGKTLNDLVKEGLSEKIMAIPKDTTIKVQKTLTRMVNENRGGMICILL